MPHDLIGFQSVSVGVGDIDAARQQLERLGFSVRADDGALLLAFGNGHLRVHAGAPLGFGAVALASRDVAATRASLCQDGLDTPGLVCALTDSPAPAAALHANGALALSSLTAVLDNPESAIPAYDRLFGLFSATPTDSMVTVHGCGPMLFLVDEDGFDHLHANLQSRLPKPPALAALSIAVADLDAAEALLKAAGVKTSRSGPSLAIAPADCLGLGLELVAG
ncbi:MAG TPA: hypothetical protein VM661_12580 [Candidatus Sulfotelmatobacter sp.]|jgi:hypothetical protein|nr:hypothetical protein [Candidatus Sulfotelmatobacter sp.]